MSLFDDRKQGFEKKFAHDEDLRFRATARRNKLIGQWAAQKLGLTGAEADAYVVAVVKSDFQKPGDEDIIGKLVTDLDGHAGRVEIEKNLSEMMVKAVAEADAARAAGG